MEAAISDLFAKYGTEGLFVVIAAFGAYYFIKARAKTTEADAAEKTADATAVSAVSHTAVKLLEHLPTIFTAITESQRVLVQTLNELLTTLNEMSKNAVSSGAAIVTHMAASNEAQAAVQVASTSAATTAAETRAAIGTALGAGSPILNAIATFTDQLKILTDQIKTSGEVDDKLRADILAQMTEINAFLTRSEAKVEKAKEKVQDEKPNEATPVQTTVELTGLLTSDVPSGDKSGGGTDK